MRRILVTGASGFVGRQVMRALADSEVSLLPVVRYGKENLVSELPQVERVILTSDIFSENVLWWEEYCRNVDVILHAAWFVEPGKYLQAPQNLACLTGSLNLAKGAVRAGVRRFVGLGTCFEYDLTDKVLSVETPLKPLTLYAATKASLYLTLSQWLPLEAVEFAWCRLFYLYGEGEDERRLGAYIRKQIQKGETAELSNGNQIRDFLDVKKAGMLIAETVLSKQTGPVNICSGIPITVRQLAEQIADECGRKDLLRFGARPENLVDPPCVIGIPNN